MNTRKFAFIASLLSVVGLLAGSAHAADPYVWDLKGATQDCSSSDFFNKGDNLVLSNGTWQVKSSGKIANLSYGSNFLPQFTIANDALLWADSIRILCSDSSKTGTMTMTVEKGGKIQLGGDNCYVNDGRKSQTDQLIIDGGEVWGNTPNFSIANPGQGGMGTEKIYGVLEIKNGGSLNIPNATLGVSVRADSVSGAVSGKARGTLTVDGSSGGAKLVAKKIYVNPKATNTKASNYQKDCHTYASSTVTFKNCEIETGDLYAYKYGAIAMTLDGATISTMSGITDTSFFTLNDKADDNETCVLGDGGVTFNIKDNYGAGAKLKFGFPASGTGFFKKTGPYNMTFSSTYTQTYTGATICEEGTLFIPTTIASTDLRAVGGTIDLTGATLPDASTIDLTLAGENGKFVALDQSKTYKSLTLGEDAVLPVAFADSAVTTFKAAEVVVTATADHPAVIDVSGMTEITDDTVILENLVNTDANLFVLRGVAGSLKIEDGKLIAVKPSRPVDTLTWAKGSEGDNWSGTDNWTYGDPAAATTFQAGDTAVFATAGDKAVVDADVTAARVEFTADATVTGEATLATTNIAVGADVTATIAAPLSEDIEKTGEGELVLRDYADGKALDLTEGKVSLVWSEGPKSNPFSMEMDANSIAGVLDLGGATQTVWVSQSASPDQTFLDGFKLLNGTLTADCENWFNVNGGRTLTVGQGATLNLNRRSGADARGGELNIRQGSAIVVDGGTFNANNARSGSAQGNVVGNDWSDGVESNTSKLLVINGGEFNSPNNYLEVGVKQGVTGILAVTNGTVNLANGTKWLSVAPGRGDPAPTGVVSMQGGTLIAETIVLCDASAGNTAQLTFEDSNISAQRIYAKKTPSQDSFVIFDGVTWTVTGTREDILADPGCPITIGDGGLTIYTDHDVTISTPLAGEGGLVKKGSGKLTFSGAQSFEGGLEVCAGSIGSTLTADGFTTQNLDLSLNLADGEAVQLTIDGTPEPGVDYTLFKSGITEETLPRLKIDANYELSLEDGQLKVKLTPLSLTWTGEGENKLWSTVANWRDAPRGPAKFDTVIFDGESDETEYDLADGLLLKEIDVNSGAWTTKVDTACFAGVPVHVETGALFALTGAKGKTNPFSTAENANAIAGVLDLGGATQAFTGALADGNGIFRDGGEIRNVALTVDPTGWFRLHNVSFTIGTNAAVTVKRHTDSKGQLNLYDSYLKIDGGSLTVLNERNIGTAGAYIGNDGDATIEILNGGSFSHPNKRVILGYGSDGKGAGSLIGDHATVDLGNKTLNLGNRSGSASCLALTNSTLTCSQITLGFEGTPGKQTVELVDTKVNLAQFNVAKLGSNSSVLFDGATIVDNHGATALLQDLGIPYTIDKGGLTVKVADLDPKKEEDYVSFPGTFEGEGDFILVAAGKTPREARFSNVAEKGFTGNVVVSNGVTVTAGGKTFKGGLYACEGSTLNVATSVFEGNVTIEAGVRFTDVPDPTAEILKPVTLLQTKGTITSPLLDSKDPLTKNRYYVRTRGEIKELCYGRKPGTMIIFN